MGGEIEIEVVSREEGGDTLDDCGGFLPESLSTGGWASLR